MITDKKWITKDDFLRFIWLFVAPIKNKAIWEVARTDNEYIDSESRDKIQTQDETKETKSPE